MNEAWFVRLCPQEADGLLLGRVGLASIQRWEDHRR